MPKRITIENAELSVTFGDVAYTFPWVTSVSINDPRENVLSMSPQETGDGIVYRTGTTLPVVADMVVREVPADVYELMKTAFKDQTRMDFLLFDNKGGDQYTLDEAIIRTNPSNLELAEGEDTFNVLVNTSCSANRFNHKPPSDES